VASALPHYNHTACLRSSALAHYNHTACLRSSALAHYKPLACAPQLSHTTNRLLAQVRALVSIATPIIVLAFCCFCGCRFARKMDRAGKGPLSYAASLKGVTSVVGQAKTATSADQDSGYLGINLSEGTQKNARKVMVLLLTCALLVRAAVELHTTPYTRTIAINHDAMHTHSNGSRFLAAHAPPRRRLVYTGRSTTWLSREGLS
jgi:hypothetical protein